MKSFETMPIDLDERLKILWQRDEEALEIAEKSLTLARELFQRNYVLEKHIESLKAEVYALYLTLQRIEDKLKEPGANRPF